MKKLLLTILFTLVLSGGAFAKEAYILFKNEETVHVASKGTLNASKGIDRAYRIGADYCGSLNKYAFHTSSPMFRKSNLEKEYIKKGVKAGKGMNNYIVYEFICSKQFISSAPSWSKDAPGKKIRWNNFSQNISNSTQQTQTNSSNLSQSNSNQNVSIEFNIKQKKEQCEVIGFKPETEKFADCVLRLVELDVKQQTQNQIVSAQNSGNDALVKQLERQNNLQSSQALINLGQQLMNPKRYNSNIYMPQTQRCTMQGFGTFATMRCR